MATVHDVRDVYTGSFDNQQRQQLLDDDLSAGRFVSGELFCIVLAGAILMALTVLYTVL